MFTIQNEINDLKVKDRNIYKILYSMNSHPVATPEMSVEEARCYILFFGEGQNLSAFIGLYLPRTDRKFFYTYSSNPFPVEGQSDVEDEARAFAEDMGFLLDEINVSGMTAEDRTHWIEEQYIFGYKKPETEEEPSESDEEGTATSEEEEEEQEEENEPVAETAPVLAEPLQEAATPPSTAAESASPAMAAPAPAVAPSPAIPPAAQEPVTSTPAAQPEPPQQPHQPHSPQYQKPVPGPGQPYVQPPAQPYQQQPPVQPSQQPPPVQPHPQQPAVQPYQQPPVQTQYSPQQPDAQPGHPNIRPSEPVYQQQPVPELGEPIVSPAPPQRQPGAARAIQQPHQAATVKKQVVQRPPRPVAREEKRVPEAEAKEPAVTFENALEAAYREQVIRRPKPTETGPAKKTSGTVARDKEALARLLASF